MKKCIIAIIVLLFSFLYVNMVYAATNTWTKKADFGGTARSGAVGFSIGVKGYIGLGYDTTSTYTQALWEYDPTANSWTQKNDFTGTGRMNATGFSIGNKGYVGLGASGTSTFYNDFYEYDPATNAWTQKATVGCSNSTSATCTGYAAKRGGAAGFSIGKKGYIGTGASVNWLLAVTYYPDFYEYDPTTNIWTKKANFPTTAPATSGRGGTTGFSIGNKGYIGLGAYGTSSSNLLQDFYEYDPTGNTWTAKAAFPGTPRGGAAGFSIGSKGYVGIGGYFASSSDNAYYNDFYEYDPTTNIWTQKANLGCSNSTDASCNGIADARYNGVGFSVGSRGYIGTGYNSTLSPNKLADFYEYEPATMPAPLYGAFTGAGIYKWDGNRWTKITGSNPQSLETSGTILYGAFGNGIWNWNGSTWTRITPSIPQSMATTATTLYGFFTGGGIWKWDGSTWIQITLSNPYLMSASGSTLYGAFNNRNPGIWKWDGSSWTSLTTNTPQLIAATSTTLYAAFTGAGIWNWNGSAWSRITPNTPQIMVASGSTLYGMFTGAGIWKWDGSTWTQITPNTPQSMEASGTNLYTGFANGIWRWDGTFWTQITISTPSSIVAVQ